MEELINSLIKEGYLKTSLIVKAFKNIDRKDFIPEELKKNAYLDEPLPIGFGQTISQPSTVAFMLELLQPKPGEKILDIGSGSGWQTALLSYCVQPNGKVYGIEIVPELVEFSKKNLSKYNFIEKDIAEIVSADGNKGLENHAPYDKIIAAASAEKIPQAWKEQIKVNGRIVAPIKQSIWLFIKKQDGTFEEKEFPGFVFVPLI